MTSHNDDLLVETEVNSDNKICRICLEDDNQSDMISPCLCSGTSKYVHRYCLDEWRSQDINGDNFKKCRECLFEYTLTTQNIYNPRIKSILYTLSSNFIYLLSIIILILFSFYKLYQSLGLLKNNRVVLSDSIQEHYLLLSIFTFISIFSVLLIIHDISICIYYKTPKLYYKNYAECGIFSFIVYLILAILFCIVDPIFGTIAITFIYHKLFSYIIKIRYDLTMVQEYPVLDLNSVDNSNIENENIDNLPLL